MIPKSGWQRTESTQPTYLPAPLLQEPHEAPHLHKYVPQYPAVEALCAGVRDGPHVHARQQLRTVPERTILALRGQ
jgi:hypothetical protein